jgi:hypothetical protein
MWTMSSEIERCVRRRSTIEHRLPRLQSNHLGDPSTLRCSVWSKCHEFDTNDPFFSSLFLNFGDSPSNFLDSLFVFFLFLLSIYPLFSLILFVLFRIIYQIWIFMQFHPSLIFSAVRFSYCSFDCYFFKMVLKLIFFFTILFSYSLFFSIKIYPCFYCYLFCLGKILNLIYIYIYIYIY